MTVVVADSSPLNYLNLIGSIEVLRLLYGTILVPSEVLVELTDPAAPAEVRTWATTLPTWVEVRTAPPGADEAALSHLDPGERSAIVLAEQQDAALLLIDDAAGRIEAARRGIPTAGTLGVLRAAALRDLVVLPVALERLLGTNFRVSPALVFNLLLEDAERRGSLG